VWQTWHTPLFAPLAKVLLPEKLTAVPLMVEFTIMLLLVP
jgi:hypothetical protein